MGTIKLTLTAGEMAEAKAWAGGAALAPLAKQAFMQKIRLGRAVTTGSQELPQVATGYHGLPEQPGSQELPSVTQGYPRRVGTVRGLTRTGTDPDLKREEEEYIEGEVREMCQRVIGHFNRKCGGKVAILDQAAIKYLNAKLKTYTEADAKAVIDWAPTRWPPGDEWRERCLNITHLFGDKFGQYLTAANQHDTEPEFKPFHPGEKFMLKPIVPER